MKHVSINIKPRLHTPYSILHTPKDKYEPSNWLIVLKPNITSSEVSSQELPAPPPWVLSTVVSLTQKQHHPDLCDHLSLAFLWSFATHVLLFLKLCQNNHALCEDKIKAVVFWLPPSHSTEATTSDLPRHFFWWVPPRPCMGCFSCVQLFATLWTVVCQAPLSMGFSRQGYWKGWPCPPPGDLPNLGIESLSHVSCIRRQVLYH